MNHHFYKTEDNDCPDGIRDQNDIVVLSLCRVCGGGEASLTAHCPGRALTAEEEAGVMAGTLEFTNDKWWKAEDYVEPERTAADGTIRKQHYGDGKQPWDDMLTLGWAPYFAAGSALKYVRRYKNKNGDDDLAKGRWYFARLKEMFMGADNNNAQNAVVVFNQLLKELSFAEVDLMDREGMWVKKN